MKYVEIIQQERVVIEIAVWLFIFTIACLLTAVVI